VVNDILYKLCKVFVTSSIDLLESKAKVSAIIGDKSWVRTFDGKGGVTGVQNGPLTYDFGEFLFRFREELYNSEEAKDLIDFLVVEKFIPATFRDTIDEENQKSVMGYNYLH